MTFLPEWAPGIHPLLVHFPIVLLIVAVLVDALSVVRPANTAFRRAAVVFFVVGALAATVTFFTGRAAADALSLPTFAVADVTDHADWATRTLWFFGLYALVRLGLLAWERKRENPWGRGIQVLLLLVGLGGLFLVVETGEHGAKLVFDHGLGVRSVSTLQAELDSLHARLSALEVKEAQAQFLQDETGSWTWTPEEGADLLLNASFQFIQGTAADLNMNASESGGVRMTPSETVLMIVPGALESLAAEIRLDVSGFTGTVRLVHHMQDAHTYDFLEIAQGRLRQGRLSEGEETIFDEATIDTPSWISLRAVSDGTHFRGYANDELLTHGHGSKPLAGPVGLYFDGHGEVLLSQLSATVLR